MYLGEVELRGELTFSSHSKITASCPITSWEIDGETVETVADFILGDSKITADGDCSHEIKRRLLLGFSTYSEILISDFFLLGINWYIIMVLVCISLMANNVKHPFICDSYPLWEKSIQILWSILNWIVFLLLSCINSLHILDICPLPYI